MKFGNLVEICLWPHLAVKGLRKVIAVRLPLGCRRASDKSPSQNYLMRYLTAYNIRSRSEVNPFPFLRDFVAGLPSPPPPCEVSKIFLHSGFHAVDSWIPYHEIPESNIRIPESGLPYIGQFWCGDLGLWKDKTFVTNRNVRSCRIEDMSVTV